jgi:hypothetical protein
MTTKRDVLFVYTTKANREFVEDLAAEKNLRISNIINTMIESYKNGKKPKFNKSIPEYVKRADAWKQKNA